MKMCMKFTIIIPLSTVHSGKKVLHMALSSPPPSKTERFGLIKVAPLNTFNINITFSHPNSQANSNLLFYLCIFPNMGITCHLSFSVWFISKDTMHMKWTFLSFLKANNIPLFVYMCIHHNFYPFISLICFQIYLLTFFFSFFGRV